MSNRVFVRNHTYETVFLHEQGYFHANQTRFHSGMTGFSRGLVLKQRHKVSQKWPIINTCSNHNKACTVTCPAAMQM